MSTHTTAPPATGAPTMAEAARIANVNLSTIRRRIADGTLTAYRLGPKLIRVDRASLERFITGQPIGGRTAGGAA